jgi:hypothetical protein
MAVRLRGGSATTNDRSARRGKGVTGDVVKNVLPESRSPMLAPPNSRHYYCVLLELRRGYCAEDVGYVVCHRIPTFPVGLFAAG